MKDLVIRCIKDREWRCRAVTALGLVALVVVVIYGRIVLSGASAKVQMVVYAFSPQEEVLTAGIFPAFEAAWKAETGQDLTIEGVFGPSGTLAGQINLGAPANVALLSNAQHVTHLKVGRRVWVDNEPVLVSQTPMVIITRPGNPYGITEFSDLGQPGLRLLHTDPRSSGAGQWALLAEYGSALLESAEAQHPEGYRGLLRLYRFQSGGDCTAAEMQLQAIWRNVRLLSSSDRVAMMVFELGAGDALVTYEHHALLAQEQGASLEIVVPSRTIVAQHVAVIVDDNVTPGERPMAQAFIRYLLSDEGQQIFSRYHLRPADLKSDPFPEIRQPFTVDDLGGWPQVYSRLVEGFWRTEIQPHLQLESIPMLLNERE